MAIRSAIRSVNAGYQDGINGFHVEIEEFGKCFGTTEFKEGSDSLDSYWNSIAEYKKIIKGSDGEEIELESDLTEYPVIIFYPSGENSGAELLVFRNEYIQKITISQNGKIINETELK
jgi:hypothetical protein